jgi:pilus assembly protein FimV
MPSPEPAKPQQDLQPAEAKANPNELDFDLDGMGLDQIETPNTIPRPMPAEPPADLGEINFDFLDEKKPDTTPAAAPIVEAKAEPSASASAKLDAVDDFLSSHNEIPDLPEVPNMSEPEKTKEVPDAKPEALEFDLSGLTLELNPAEPKAGLVEETYGVHDTSTEDYSNNAEMATKLDLALAYQEIGDKEGARELLDEVVKGGTAEQAEKAKSLLLKLA